jgi:hypothetical protein
MSDLPLGGNENDLVLEPGQDLVLRDTNGIERLRLDAATGTIRIRTGNGLTRVLVDPDAGNIFLGGSGQDGDLLLFPSDADSFETADSTIHVNAGGRSIGVGTPQLPGLVRIRGNAQQIDLVGERGDIIISGHLDLRTDEGELRCRLSHDGTLVAGGAGRAGMVNLRNDSGATIIRLDLGGSEARGRFGGNGSSGRIELVDGDDSATIVLNGTTGNVGLGNVGGGNAGALFVKDGNGNDAIVLNGDAGNVAIGSAAGRRPGAVFVKDALGEDTIVLNGAAGNAGLGRLGVPGNLFVKDGAGNNSIHLSGETGNINLTGDIRFSSNLSDCAEEFDLAEAADAEPGAVMVLDDEGLLRTSTIAYDTRAVGVVSGAGAFRPGIILGREEGKSRRVSVAMIGKVFCRVDASYGPIRVGDFLTTSPTPAHAMKVLDPDRAIGAIVGKALAACASGRRLVPMLVTLQ